MGYYKQVGDPFFGMALPALGKLATKLPVFRRGAAKLGGLVGRVAGRIGARTPKVIKTAGGIAAGGAVFEAGSRVAGRAFGGEGRKYRRMNVANVRALRRAIRRANGFAKLARSVLTFTSPRAPRGKAMFKKRGRK